jgi:signal transduction histidine kinase
LYFIPPIVVHLHVEYASIRELILEGRQKWTWLVIAWLPAVLLTPTLLGALKLRQDTAVESPSQAFGTAFQVWLVTSMLIGAWWQWRLAKTTTEKEQKTFHKGMGWDLTGISCWLILLVGAQLLSGEKAGAGYSLVAMALGLVPLIVLIGNVQRFNFLQIGRQGNLMYAVFVTFLALLYLSFVRRASLWLEPFLPPEAMAALLLFLPVVFFEPLQRAMRRLLRRTAQTEVDRAQKLMGPINDLARRGDLGKLTEFSERWIAEQLQLAQVQLSLEEGSTVQRLPERAQRSSEECFEIRRAGKHIGSLRVRAHGAMISGETYAALEFLCEQLPSAFDLCRLIEEKLQLERELAERERLALVGQMAASISHNLKNPLGSMKTILQLQMENPELPASMRQETQMVLEEISRLSAKLNQLLQFSRPGVRSAGAAERCNLEGVAENVVSVLRHEAESRGIRLELVSSGQECEVAASGEVANDILSNLVLNALEAVASGGHVRLLLEGQDGNCRASVEDDGPGIPEAVRGKILQPFFTTKARGTGLGLAIVARRVEEIGGELFVESPIQEERGSRFSVLLPLAAKEIRT